MTKELQAARKLAKELYEQYVSPFEIIDRLNAEFEHFFYLSHGNIYRLVFGDPVADMIYNSRKERENES